ncbi:DNA helicase/exodeoxyribonuclease V, subunit B [Oscillibacter sp. PC13]|uniref:PD-(D/E)XK nuclease family protein n=1 Tax=Oscillibacter sp. PC13 TaxID=1855299 RepID=UPI0008EEDEAD|nr:PD-(D/E)XK nuclease family protein [Oscillibacter sp. PC13]SFP72568.1 DNA helicase/exodeoxyribonuclease V, subunit B [Oscillibacter sp. PC13]
MLTILIGRAKTGKSDYVLRRIADLGDTGRQILLVPEHASHQAEVDLCRVCGPTASRHAEVLSFRRLSDRVLSITGGISQVTLDAGGKLLTLQKALMEVAPKLRVYRRPSQKAAFLQQMLDLFDELRSYEVTPEKLYTQAEEIQGATREKLLDLSLLYGAYEARLCRPGFDRRDRMSKLCDYLEESGYAVGKDFFIDGFTYFNAQERRALEIILRQAASVTVTLLGEKDSHEEMFEASLKTRDQLVRLAQQAGCSCECVYLTVQERSALGHLEQYFFGENLSYEGDAAPIHIRETDTAFSEVEQTAADIRRLVAAGKCRYRDITVGTCRMGDYESLIEVIFERYGIPVYLSRRSDMLEKPVWSLLIGVLSSIENGFEYEDMFRWLKTGLAGLRPEECDVLENYVLKWEIHGQMWLRETDWTDHPEGYGARWNDRQQARLEEINLLRRRVQKPLLQLFRGLKDGKTALDKVHVLYSFMEDLKLQATLEQQMQAQAENGQLQEAEETAQLWEILCGILDQFAEILGDEPIELDEFFRLLQQVAAQYSVGTIPVSLDQVSVSEITRNDRHTTSYLFLLGTNDHVLPNAGQRGGILNEEDRDELAQRGITLAPTGMEQMGIELQNLYAALAQPTAGLTVSYPTADVSGTELRPAFVIGRMQALFPSLRLERDTSEKEYRLSAVVPALETAGEAPDGSLWRYFKERDCFRERLTAMERAAGLKRGALSPAAVQALYGSHIRMTASRLERLRSCHFAYFMEYGLKARPREAAAFDAPQIGTFLHFLLEHVTKEVLGRGGFAQVEVEELHALVRRYIDQYVEQELHNFQNRNARFRYLFARLRNTAYAVVDQIAQEMRHSDFIPLEFELSFGDNGQLPAVVIAEPDGEMRVGGKVDRVDGWVKDNKLYLRVVDYKSGRKAFDLAAVRMGLDIQMLLYLFALQKEGKQRFGMEIEPAGVLYLPARDEILAAERNISPERLQIQREKELRRTGLLLSEPEVLQAMEHEALETPRFLPLRVSRDGNVAGSLASAAQLGRLGQYVEKLLHQITREVRDGNIDADPCCHSEDDSFCKFCDWSGACHFQDGRDRDHLNYILPVKAEVFWQMLEEEEKGGKT